MSQYSVLAVKAFGDFSAQPLWTVGLAAPVGGWDFLCVENTTNVRVEGTFDGTNEHWSIIAGGVRTWDYSEGAAQPGAVSIRGDGADPASGSVYIEGRARG